MPKYIHRITISLLVILSFYSVAKITLAEGSRRLSFIPFSPSNTARMLV